MILINLRNLNRGRKGDTVSKENNIPESRLHTHSLVPLIMLSILEYEVFTFSKATVAAAKQDAWLSILIGALIGSFFVFLFIKLAARFPNMNYFHYLPIVWGKPFGFLISSLYLFFWIAYLSSIFYETLSANRMLFLPRTPDLIPLALFALSLIWLVSYGLVPLIRFLQLILPFVVIPLLLLTLLFTIDIKISRFIPVLDNGLMPVLKGSFYFLGAYQGPEVLLFAAPFFLKIREGVKPALLGFNAIVFFGWSNTVAAIGTLGVDTITEATLPGINVVNLVEFPGFPVERFGLLLTLPWLTGIYSTLAIYLYLLCSSTFQLFKISHKKLMTFLITSIPVVLAYFLPNEAWHEHLRLYLTIITVPMVYILPVLTLLLAIIRKKGQIT